MNILEYQEAAGRTCPKLTKEYEHIDSLHMILGMTTEVSELADVFKKNLAYNKEIDWINVKEEIGDIFWYLINFCTINNIDVEKQLYVNIEKLIARFPEKFNSENAINRNLEKERQILES
jgi:NTP pyrophosphatase (non-canonical NTP hydrolase)